MRFPKGMPQSGFIFDTSAYASARDARLRCLFDHVPAESFRDRRVLELGAGTGQIGAVLTEAGARVVSVDAVPAYIDELRRRYPDREAHVIDLEAWDGTGLGAFDSVLCFGLLYHTSNPRLVLEACRRAAPVLFLETVVSDKEEAVCPLVEESGPDQATSGRGSRPTPAWLRSTLEELGYQVQDISSATANWQGAPDSVFDWVPRNDWGWLRGNCLLRKMYLARVLA
jgi:SAM-dependent methyltransferase